MAYYTVISTITRYVPNPTYTTSALMTVADFSTALTATSTFAAGILLQDMGRFIVVYDPSIAGSPHVAKFRQVMLVSGEDREGQNTTSNMYICVWQDYPGRGYTGGGVVAKTG
jgi:hypothetical protein